MTAVYSSPLRRAMQTAQAASCAQGMEARRFGALLDVDLGVWQGLSFTEAQSCCPDLHKARLEAPQAIRLPRGESVENVRARVTRGVDDIWSRAAGPDVVMVGRAVVNRVLPCAVLGLGNECFWRIEQDTCAVSVFSIGDEGLKTFDLMNDTSHLRAVAEQSARGTDG